MTATSSYINVPPPFTHIYSAGGPTGEVHAIDSAIRGFGEKIQQFLFVPEDELEAADKTRIALRYGSHGIEFSAPLSLAFIPVLGTDSIEVYTHDKHTGLLTHVHSSPSPRGKDAHDGPRHVKVHPNGKVLYCVTEHTNFIDSYSITSSPPYLTHLSSRTLLPPHLSESSSTPVTFNPNDSHVRSRFRGDTLLLTPSIPLHPNPRTIWATTRGANQEDRGWISVFKLDEDGDFVKKSSVAEVEGPEEVSVERYQAPTSGGKAHAIDLYAKELLPASSPSYSSGPSSMDMGMDTDINATSDSLALNKTKDEGEGAVYILLTDDSDAASLEFLPDGSPGRGGGVRILEWDGWGRGGVREVVGWPEPGTGIGASVDLGADTGKERMIGASHAVWLD
ncbi:hypothetical protein D9758_012701 [Tetrapyrgos nigripes]|uniref:Isomerase YbhE n=1 Tax=Tetrapyrgos nigripes TaxID=182062 RepID=A0A8H5FTF2_9AGAR|nr:hypothetical protein D9758_012701 [Tetrapyrgos nigripes]